MQLFVSEILTPNGTNKMSMHHILCLALWIFGMDVVISRFERPCEAR
jgi:hypothetical protein